MNASNSPSIPFAALCFSIAINASQAGITTD
jgi:hypothetical protein